MNKRAANAGITFLVWALLAIALLVGVLSLVFPHIFSGGKQIASFAPSQDETCLRMAKTKEIKGGDITDKDDDGYPDSCDSCVCTRDKCDSDNSKEHIVRSEEAGVVKGLPPACRKSKEEPQKYSEECKEGENLYKTQDGAWQCYLG